MSSDEDLSSNSPEYEKETDPMEGTQVLRDSIVEKNNLEYDSDEDDSEDCDMDYREYAIESKLLRKLVETLRATNEAEKTKSYFAEGTINSDEVSLTVVGMGNVTFPIKFETATKLIDMATLAPFGHREQTKQDENVRDTYMIPKEKLNVTIKNFSAVLNEIKTKLSLNEDSNLEAHLHNMLIYEKGQHFDFHQDTEKMNNMVATLVVAFPSAHVGGNLVIKHLDKMHIFATEMVYENNIKYTAFYSDCYHKVEKVKDGFRIVLTYNLVLCDSKFRPTISCSRRVISILRRYFDNEKQGRGIRKLIYLFDHRYTKTEIKFSNLKGRDIVTASALVSAAKELNLVVRLALADIHEYWGDEEDDEIRELSTTLSSWRDQNDQPLECKAYKAYKQEICWSKHNVNLKAHDIDKNDYTGNAGATEERWYKRAAIILWPRSSDFAVQFELDPDSEFKKLEALIESPNNQKSVRDIIKKAGEDFFLHAKSYNYYKKLVKMFTRLAIYIKDPNEAIKICRHFSCNIFDDENPNMFFELKMIYGSTWCLQLITESCIHKTYSLKLIRFTTALKEDDRALIELILKHQTEICAEVRFSSENQNFIVFGWIVKAARETKYFDCLNDLFQSIMSKVWDVQNLTQFLIQHCTGLRADIINDFRDKVIALLQEDINTYKQSHNERVQWLSKIKFPSCRCELCNEIAIFLKKGGRVKEFFCNKRNSQHVMNVFGTQNKESFSMTVKQGWRLCLVVEKKIDIVDNLETKLAVCVKQMKTITGADPNEGEASGSKSLKHSTQSDCTETMAKKPCT